MADPSPALLKTIRVVDTFSDWSGKAVAWLILPLFLSLTYEGIARYLFNAPDAVGLRPLLHAVRGALHARRPLHAAQGRAHPDGHALGEILAADEGPDRRDRPIVFFFFPAMILLFYASVDEAWALLADGRALRADGVAADPLALQGRGAAHRAPPPDPGRLGAPQVPLRRAHRPVPHARPRRSRYERQRDSRASSCCSSWSA